MSGWLPGNQTVLWALWTYMVLRLLFLFFDIVWAASACADCPQSLPEMGGYLMGGFSLRFFFFSFFPERR